MLILALAPSRWQRTCHLARRVEISLPRFGGVNIECAARIAHPRRPYVACTDLRRAIRDDFVADASALVRHVQGENAGEMLSVWLAEQNELASFRQTIRCKPVAANTATLGLSAAQGATARLCALSRVDKTQRARPCAHSCASKDWRARSCEPLLATRMLVLRPRLARIVRTFVRTVSDRRIISTMTHLARSRQRPTCHAEALDWYYRLPTHRLGSTSEFVPARSARATVIARLAPALTTSKNPTTVTGDVFGKQMAGLHQRQRSRSTRIYTTLRAIYTQ